MRVQEWTKEKKNEKERGSVYIRQRIRGGLWADSIINLGFYF